ncbi:MAG: leucine zipper domain-containing protein [Acidimicrobiia bacterium]|nr:leucine zipper domain-containing protein [Acidimicrobiia bacterium]
MHRNAPLTPEGGIGFVCASSRLDRRCSRGIHEHLRQCAHKWWSRYRDEGVEGLEDRSSRPLSCPHQTPRC